MKSRRFSRLAAALFVVLAPAAICARATPKVFSAVVNYSNNQITGGGPES
jgi:hypothetical protein